MAMGNSDGLTAGQRNIALCDLIGGQYAWPFERAGYETVGTIVDAIKDYGLIFTEIPDEHFFVHFKNPPKGHKVNIRFSGPHRWRALFAALEKLGFDWRKYSISGKEWSASFLK